MRDIAEIVLRSFAVFLLLGSAFSAVVGLALILRQRTTIEAFARMNRWVSTRRALKPLEIPRQTGQLLVGKGRIVAGLVFALCGAYAAFALVSVDAARLVPALGVGGGFSPLADIAIRSARWTLILGCAAAGLGGVVLLFLPSAWQRVEAGANRWYSTRRAVAGADTMIVPLDLW